MVTEPKPNNLPDDTHEDDSRDNYSHDSGAVGYSSYSRETIDDGWTANELARNELANYEPHNPGLPSTALAPRSGSEVAAGSAPGLASRQPAYPAHRQIPRERTDGVTILSLYHFALGLLTMVGAFVMAIPTVITGIVGSAGDPDIFWITAILGVATFFLMGLALMYFLVGIGLWRLKQWSRVAAMALAAISLPTGIGTIPGALTLWYLLKKDKSSLFR